MNDANSLIIVAIVGALSSVLVQFLGEWFRRGKIVAETGKTKAEANALTSAEWRALYKEMSTRLDKVERELDIAKDYIQYLWAGTVALSNQIRAEGKEPVFKPTRNFRGSDDFDADEWAWIEGR